MKKTLFVLLAFVVFTSHDMYLKLDSYFLQPHTQANIKLFNGTFDKSDNVITRDRMVDISMLGNGARSQIDTGQWSERDNMTILSFETGEAGTWVAGLSTRARNIEMSGADFNAYLEHDGVLDMLLWRQENNALDKDAVEKYSKHVKTIFQVGDVRTDDWQKILGYPIEFIPLGNPYDTHAGHELQFELLWQGQPLANQLVYAAAAADGHSHEHTHHGENAENEHADEDHDHHHGAQLRTDSHGVLTVPLTSAGVWYLRTIHLVHSEEPGLTHESNWATLTFEIGAGHGMDAHDVSHSVDHHHHEEDDVLGIPSYVFWIGSLLLVAGLFFWFNRQS